MKNIRTLCVFGAAGIAFTVAGGQESASTTNDQLRPTDSALESAIARLLPMPGNGESRLIGQRSASSIVKTYAVTRKSDSLVSEPSVEGLMIKFSSEALRNPAEVTSELPSQLMESLIQATGVALQLQRPMSMDMFVLRFPKTLSVSAATDVARQLKGLAAVEEVELDVRVKAEGIPNDTYFYLQHNLLSQSTFLGGIDAVNAWDLTTGSANTVVAIVDTGVLNHAEFQGRLLAGFDFVSAPQMGNDGDGRDGNAADPGDWVTDAEARASGCASRASSWHGTHVAGIVAARGNNSYGLAGINWSTRILPVRVLGKCGGTASDAIDGMLWAAGMPVVGAPVNTTPAQVINMSLGVYSPAGCSAVYQAAIQKAKARGAVVVVAAGNSADEAARYVPAACKGVISVGAVDLYGLQASYSNYSTQFKVAISAPGGDSFYGTEAKIPSTYNTGQTSPSQDAFIHLQGTSMAAPHVAGIASLALAVNPNLSAAELSALLLLSSHNFNSNSVCAKYWPLCGAGIANAANMVRASRDFKPFTTVTEFYNADYNHFFRTGSRDEPAAVESGALGNWINTEDYFIAWRDSSLGASPVCRFYSYKFNSHFYTVDSNECAGVKKNADWTYEGISFYAKVPTAAGCPQATVPIHRFYNNRHGSNDGNHRLTPYKDYYMQQLISAGWIYEGVKLCAAA